MLLSVLGTVLFQLGSGTDGYTVKQYNSRFEVPNPGDGLPFLDLNGSVPGIYNGVKWSNFQLPSYTKLYASQQCVGVCASSYPYQAVARPVKGSNELAAVSAIYKGSRTESFDLTSFAAGCSRVGDTPFPTPSECTISLHGYHGREQTGTATMNASFAYNPDLSTDGGMGAMSAEMTVFKLPPAFKSMQTVTFRAELIGAVKNGRGLNVQAELHIDDFRYTVRNMAG